MPLQNRVDPFGALHAVSAQGTMMGNRGGRIHLPNRTLGKARWKSRQWICCEISFRGRRRNVWGDSYTELFFLDEVTALAAGHRPCFECRNKDAKAFLAGERAGDFDRRVHAERLAHAQGWDGPLPDGTIVDIDGEAYAVKGGHLHRWSFTGYGVPEPLRKADRILTPPSIVAILARGYKPRWHLSIKTPEAS